MYPTNPVVAIPPVILLFSPIPKLVIFPLSTNPNNPCTLFVVNGKIVCRKLTKKNVGFPTYFLYSQSMI